MRTHSYRPLVVVATAILAAVARYAPVIDEPWDRSAGSTNGAIYFGRFEQNFERLGFAELRGAPLFYVLPMRDHPGSLLYWHHPPLIPWLIRGAVAIGGYSERTFRLVPIVCSTLTAVLLALLVGAARGTRVGHARL